MTPDPLHGRRAAALLLATVALAWACAASGRASGRPEWVDGELDASSGFPPGEYVTGVGSGPTDADARRSARAEISRIFQTRVESDLSDTSRTTTSEADGRQRTTVIQRLDIDTRVTSSGTFEGVHVAETWLDTRTGTHYALAVLSKEKTRSVLLGQLRDAADRTHGSLVRSDTAPTYLGRGRALVAATRASAEVDALVSRARVVGRPQVVGLPGTGEIERDLAATLANTRVAVRAVEVDPATGRERGGLPALQEELEETINGIGFKVVGPDSAGAPNVWLACRMSLREIDRGLDTHFVRWEGAFELTGPPPHGPVILSSRDSGGESFSSADLARTRAVMKGSAKLAGELERQIARYLADEPGH